MPKSSSMAAMSWSGPGRAGVDLVGAVGAGVRDEQVAGEGEDRQRGIGRVEVEDHHDIAVDAVDPLGAEAVGGVLDVRAHRDVDPTMRMFSVPVSTPLTGAEVRPLRSIRWILWLRYQA